MVIGMVPTREGRNEAGPDARRTRRRLDPNDRRSELLDAAIRVLRAVGPRLARVEDVTRAAGAAKGTFYLYFPSWDDLLAAVREHLLSAYAAQARARLTAAPALPWTAVENECMRFVDYVVDLGELHEAVFHGPTAKQPVGEQRSAEALVAEMLTMGIAAGSCRSVPADTAAPLLFSVLHTTADSIARAGNREARIEALLQLLRAWLRVVNRSPGRSVSQPSRGLQRRGASLHTKEVP